MIKSIKKKEIGNKLEVVVEYKARKYAHSHKKEEMTTKDLVKLLETDYPITKVISVPKKKVTNDTRGAASLIGKWVFEFYNPLANSAPIKSKPPEDQ